MGHCHWNGQGMVMYSDDHRPCPPKPVSQTFGPFPIVADDRLPPNVLCVGYIKGKEKAIRYNPEVRERNECEKRKHTRPDPQDA